MNLRTATALAGILAAPLLVAAPAAAHEPGKTAQAGRSAYCTDNRVNTVNLRGTLRFVRTSTRTGAAGHFHTGIVQLRVVRDGRVTWINGDRKTVKCGPGSLILAGHDWT